MSNERTLRDRVDAAIDLMRDEDPGWCADLQDALDINDTRTVLWMLGESEDFEVAS